MATPGDEVGDLDGVAEDTVVAGMYGRLVPRGLALGFTNPVCARVPDDVLTLRRSSLRWWA